MLTSDPRTVRPGTLAASAGTRLHPAGYGTIRFGSSSPAGVLRNSTVGTLNWIAMSCAARPSPSPCGCRTAPGPAPVVDHEFQAT